MNTQKETDVLEPGNQVNLYGYEDYFKYFKNLYKKNKLPNTMLLSGQKGLGKSTFAYHFINYLLSQGEEDKYSLENFTICSNNYSFRSMQNGTHPNFFLLSNITPQEAIKVDQTRYLIKYLSKTTYSKDIKIVLLDNAELLNLNASNALLKALEEPSNNTFFFIINNNPSKIIDTIKSRCIDFKFHFKISEKKNIFRKITQNYQLNFEETDLDKFLYFDTPGNFLRYLLILKDSNLNISKDYLACISYLINLYITKKDSNLLNFISLFIEKFYNEISLNNGINVNYYFTNKNKILYLIRDMNKFHLDKKNLLFSVDRILKNENQ